MEKGRASNGKGREIYRGDARVAKSKRTYLKKILKKLQLKTGECSSL